jgi:hypothetical protein
MPTGYTADVQSGKITRFEDFAMQCARAFGALLMMRDDPLDAPVPEEFKPSDYYREALDRNEKRLAELKAMSPAAIIAASRAAQSDALARHEAHEAGKAEHRARYEAMLAKVRAWTPPTPEHEGLRAFMEQQLTESIRFDCRPWGPPEQRSPAAWYELELSDAEQAVARSRKALADEIERTEGRNRWLADLRRSLTAARAALKETTDGE